MSLYRYPNIFHDFKVLNKFNTCVGKGRRQVAALILPIVLKRFTFKDAWVELYNMPCDWAEQRLGSIVSKILTQTFFLRLHTYIRADRAGCKRRWIESSRWITIEELLWASYVLFFSHNSNRGRWYCYIMQYSCE